MRFVSTRASAIMLAAVLLAAAIPAIRPHVAWEEDRLPAHWSRRIARAPDAAAAAMVRGLAPSSPAAVRALVGLAASPRSAVAQAAQDALDEWTFSLERRRPAAPDGNEAATGKLARALSGELARNSDRFGPAGGRWARQLCRRLLDIVAALPRRDRVELIQDCEAVLAAGGNGNWRSGLDAPPGNLLPEDMIRPDQQVVSAADEMLRFALQSGQPVGIAESVTDSTASAGESRAEASTGTPGAVPSPGAEETAEALAADDPAPPTASGPGLGWRAKGGHYARVQAPSAAAPQTLDVPSPQATKALEEELLHAPLAEVLDALGSEDPFESASAAAVLRARGMSQVDLQVARSLTDADAEARLMLLDDVARRPGASTSAWLHHFADDESSEVRLRALTLLGTSRDEQLVRQVRARALHDEDPRIRALAERLDLFGTETR